MIHIGLTGGIGSGKSTVAKMWQDLGAHLLDADQVSRALTAKDGAAIKAIEETFGVQMLNADRSLNRDAMRALVFSDPTQKTKLEGILHPMIAKESEHQINLAQQSGVRVLIHDIPLLVESPKWLQRVDKVLVIDCSKETQIKRVKARNALSTEQIEHIIQSQASRQARLAVADWVIENEHQSLGELRQAVKELYTLALTLAG
jgi:dephospho-CoA kinase